VDEVYDRFLDVIGGVAGGEEDGGQEEESNCGGEEEGTSRGKVDEADCAVFCRY